MNNNANSILRMEDIYFPSFNFKFNKENNTNMELDINYNINIEKIENSKTKVTIETIITNKYDLLSLDIVCIGIFSLDDNYDNVFDEKTKEDILHLNTISIMFPYIRSQIALITTQPGLNTIQLPIIDVNKLLNKNN